jgi:hypothetical protein
MIAQEGIGQEHKGKATTGKILGTIALVLQGVSVVVLSLLMMLGVLGAAAGN